MTILLVDGNKEALDQETERLKNQQFAATVSLYSSADDAIRFAMYHDVDIVFTRAVLAEMTGRELVEKIHSFKPEIKCHILLRDEEVPFGKFIKPCRSTTQEQEATDDTSKATDKSKNSPHISIGGRVYRRIGLHVNTDPQGRDRGDIRMTEQELRSLSRKELLEIMIEQGKELEANRTKYEKDLEFIKSEYEKEIEAIQIERDKDRHEIETKCQSEKESMQAQHEEEVEQLKKELEELRSAVGNREIMLDEAGSIAVAALQLNGVFEAAQAASQQYIENIRMLNERQASICAKRDAEHRAEMERRLQETTAKCVAMEAEAKQRSEAYWAEVSRRLQAFYENHKELKKLLNFSVPNIPV